ncbi:MAG: GntR family transcriptional regulator [Marinosulfonomonas sp.]
MSEEILAKNIADQLRRNILRGKLAPGAAIKERDNAMELGVSRTPLREAIRILATEGLVELRPARSPIVSMPTPKQFSDDIEVLVSVEKLSGELACERATDEEIEEIDAIVKEMAAKFDTVDPLDLFELDMQFHSAIAQASHNVPLAEIHRKFLARLWHARFLAAIRKRNRDRVIGHHTDIVTALRFRDPKAVREAIGKHIKNLNEDIVHALAQEKEDTTKGHGKEGR